MSRIDQLDRFEIPDDLTDADAEYVRIQLGRCKDNIVAKRLQTQLLIIEKFLHDRHREMLTRINRGIKV